MLHPPSHTNSLKQAYSLESTAEHRSLHDGRPLHHLGLTVSQVLAIPKVVQCVAAFNQSLSLRVMSSTILIFLFSGLAADAADPDTSPEAQIDRKAIPYRCRLRQNPPGQTPNRSCIALEGGRLRQTPAGRPRIAPESLPGRPWATKIPHGNAGASSCGVRTARHLLGGYRAY